MSKEYFTQGAGVQTNYGRNVFVESAFGMDVGTFAAAGSTATDATALSGYPTYVVTGADGTVGVKLPVQATSTSGTIPRMSVRIYNSSASTLKVYPDTGGNINGGSTNASVNVAANTYATFQSVDGTIWAGNYTAGGTNATLTGAETLTNKTLTTPTIAFNAQSVAAAGSVQGDAVAITAAAPACVLVTGANATKGAVLPAATAGAVYILKNDDTANAILKVWPAGTNTINALGASNAISMAAKASCLFMCVTANAWITVPTVPS